MGNVLGWFGLKKPPPSPKVARREPSPPPKSEKSKCQDAPQSVESRTSKQSEEDPPETKVSSPPKPETPASVSKPATVQSSPKPDRGPPPVRPPAPKCKIDEISKPIDISTKAQENVQSLANIAKEEVKNLTESVSKTAVDTAEGLVTITTRTTTLIQESTIPSVPSIDVSQLQARVAGSSELVKNADPFEMVSVCPVVAVCPPCIEESETGDEDSPQSMVQETAEEAAVKIQAGIRGYLTRKALKDRFSPAPESLLERQTETSQTKSDTETENSSSKTSSTKVVETTVKTAVVTPSTHGQEHHETRVTVSNLNAASREKIPNKAAESVQKEESSARSAGQSKPIAQPQSQVAGALGKTSQIVRPEMTKQVMPAKVSMTLQEDEEEWDEEVEDEEEDIVDEEPTPPASPPIQIKKQVATPPGAPSSTKTKKH